MENSLEKSCVDGKFDKLIVTVRLQTDNDEEVVNLLKRRYERANPVFTCSTEFVSMIDKLSQQIVSDKKNKFIYIKDFIQELKAYGLVREKKRKRDALTDTSDTDCSVQTSKEKRRCTTTVIKENSANDSKNSFKVSGADNSHTEIPSDVEFKDPKSVSTGSKKERSKSPLPSNLKEENDEKDDEPKHSVAFIPSEEESVKDEKNNKRSDVQASTSESNDNCENGGKKKGSQRQIKRLEDLLKEISDEIQLLEEKEYSLDDLKDEESDIILEDRLKKRFIKVWNKICEIKGREPTTGRVTERKFRFEGTRFPEINRKVEKFINNLKIFPDFNDIHDLVMRVNFKKKLRLGKAALEDLARDAFTAVGNQLQERRQNDFVDNFGNHLTDKFRSYDDPALFDRSLRKKLEENRSLAKNRLDEVISKFAYKQDCGSETSSGEEEEEVDEPDMEDIIPSMPADESDDGDAQTEKQDSDNEEIPKRHECDSSSDSDEDSVAEYSDSSDAEIVPLPVILSIQSAAMSNFEDFPDQTDANKLECISKNQPGETINEDSVIEINNESQSEAKPSIDGDLHNNARDQINSIGHIDEAPDLISNAADHINNATDHINNAIDHINNATQSMTSRSVTCEEEIVLESAAVDALDSQSNSVITLSDSQSVEKGQSSQEVLDITPTKLQQKHDDTSVLCSKIRKSKLSLSKSKSQVYIDRVDGDEDAIEIDSDSSSSSQGSSKCVNSTVGKGTGPSLGRAKKHQMDNKYKLKLSNSFVSQTKRIVEEKVKRFVAENFHNLSPKSSKVRENHDRVSIAKQPLSRAGSSTVSKPPACIKVGRPYTNHSNYSPPNKSSSSTPRNGVNQSHFSGRPMSNNSIKSIYSSPVRNNASVSRTIQSVSGASPYRTMKNLNPPRVSQVSKNQKTVSSKTKIEDDIIILDD